LTNQEDIIKHYSDDGKESIAVFSHCMKYRYYLSRAWGKNGGKAIMFLMLNPSTADEVKNDPTVERCERRARAMGYDSFIVCNIFAYRATNPKDMRVQKDPVGQKNDQYIVDAAKVADRVICAWGSHGSFMNRNEWIRKLLKESGAKVFYLRMTASGNPSHPLYLPYSEEPKEWEL